MSMTQEEIEALMSGIDASDEEGSSTQESSPPEPEPEDNSNEQMSEDDIEGLIAQTNPEDDASSQSQTQEESQAQEQASQSDQTQEESAEKEPEKSDEATLDELEQAQQDASHDEESKSQATPQEKSSESESSSSEDIPKEPESAEDYDDILAGIDGVVDDAPKQEQPEQKEEPAKKEEDADRENIGRSWTDEQINSGVFPMPVEKNTKVVGQLSEVANDSEEKATKIFDVLSYILDENNEVQKGAKELDDFVKKQTLLLESLTKKFPNIAVFQKHLEHAQSLSGTADSITQRVDQENMQLFEAMELMQFHDINRQKIERVMSVIRKLTNYLNGIFEDDDSHADVAVAKHISGDSNSELVGDEDLDALIAEFGN